MFSLPAFAQDWGRYQYPQNIPSLVQMQIQTTQIARPLYTEHKIPLALMGNTFGKPIDPRISDGPPSVKRK